MDARAKRERFEILAQARTRACSPRALATAFSSRALSRIAARACALALAVGFAMPAGAIDGTATVTGGEVAFYGATETNWLNGTELLLKFEGEGSFVLPGLSKARILAVGGGGGGGGVRSNSAGMAPPYGGGGGGGAGGFVEMTNVFSAATYAIAVGAGGAGGASASTHIAPYYPGKSGGNTTIMTNGVSVINAVGGGGGGGETDGLSGGSGGGGSQYRAASGASGGSPRVGGAGTDGQGFVGGAGDVSVYGGGGGGASSAGAAASTLNPIGGDGASSDISGEILWYSGGGGGGFSDKSFTGLHDPIAGGKGGGGGGGYGLNVSCTDATFYGGGGGGCGALPTSSTLPGGSGYQGVVYVRIIVIATGEIVKPSDLLDVSFDGKEHVLVPANTAYTIVDLTEGSATYGQVVEKMAGTLSGTYKAKVTLVDGFKWPDGTTDEITVTLTISKATPVISNLSIRDWIEGTPLEATPNPGCDVSIAVTPAYFYGESSTGPWNTEKPTVAGDYWLRAYIAGTASYNEAEATKSFKILKGPGDIYRDYVDITIDGASPAKTDFVYTLKLSEGNPKGFLYSRAGNTGEDLAITDADGNLLDYKVDYWDAAGESTLWIKLPTLPTTGLKIRLFWYLREDKTAPERPGEISDSSEGSPGCVFDLVVRDGKRVNYWLTEPLLTKTKWDVLLDTPGAVESVGTIKEGASSLLYVTNLNTGAVYDGIENIGGSFSAIFGPHDPAGDYEPMEFPVDYFVIGHPSYSDLSGEYFGEEDALTRNGRVLLANDDSAPGGYSVKGQSYWQTDSEKYTTYWVHSGEHHASTFPYLYNKPYNNHILYNTDSDGNPVELWTLEDVMIGNPYTSTLVPSSSRCYLPNSPTAKAISSETATPGLAEQGNLVMRNKEGAAITSPIYTNGVGTIYFDAVNENKNYATSGSYNIKVEVSLDAGTNYTPYAMKPFKRENTAAFVANQTDTTELALDVTTGGTADNFYRIAVPVNSSANVRFRIVRTTYIDNKTWDVDEEGFILIDNILVSYPKSTASLEPYGKYDAKLKGQQVVGWGGAMSVPFPAAGDSVYARAKAIVNTNVNAHVAVDMPISWAQMWYHWRYLDQQTNDWQAINLRPSDNFASIKPLDLPVKEGDVEFWYEYIVQVPAYKYYDYSGLGLDLNDADGKALYTEDVTESKNTQADVTGYEHLASGGTDWFFRLRRGKSDFESFTIYVKESEDGEVREYPMSLSGNHMWRGLCPTREEIEGGMLVRIAGKNRQTPGSEDYNLEPIRYSLAKSTSVLPATDVLSERSDESWEWFAVPCDAKSGNVLIQLQDDTLAYTIVHADYQDFNGWTDANKKDVANGIFVGTWKDGESTPSAYTTPDAITYSSNFTNWNATVATNAYWSETFPATKAELDAGTWPLYKPFGSTLSPNTAFTVGPGQWVNGYYRDNSTGMALQMEGKGKGYIQFVDAAESPRGLESVTFKARVAQAVEFGDFCYFMTDPTSLKNYTFMTAASFDINGRKDFAGNASLSLVALYTPGIGCYELRVEQENVSITAGVVSPGTTFRISLYRWAYDDEAEEIVAEELGTTTHANGSNMFATTSEGGNYARLFISVDTSVDGETRIVGGVARTSVARSSFFGSQSYREVAYRDGADNRLTSGSYGLLAANCPAHFLQPSYGATTVAFGAGWSKPAKNKFDGNNYGNYTLTPIATASRVLCQSDIAAGRWTIKKGRMTAVNASDLTLYGINAVIPETTIDVYTAPGGTTDWKPLETNIVVRGFGSSSSAGATTTIPLYSLDDVSVQIRTGGGPKTARKDVTVDDIEFRQWRGESYDEKGQYGVFDRTGYGSPTNIVFTQGWMSNGVDSASNPRKTCLLSAKRSYSTVATSIRSPRMVDENTDKGLGLGSVSFDYENAQSNAVVLVQIATNGVALSGFADLAKSTSSAEWTTVTNIDFSAMTPEERKSGSVRIYIGLHGARGAMRIALDPKVVKAVEKVMDPTAFGELTVTGVSFRDEPELDKYSWWGWNLRTTDDPAMRSLADNTADQKDVGLSFGLNNSVTDDIRKDEPAEQFAKKLPFVQTPTFATNLVNEVSFMARLYDTNDAAARVTLYGARSGDLSVEDLWVKIASWDVTNATYEVYSKKFAPGNPYMAFRLAVTGVAGVTEPMQDEEPLVPAARVLIDEVLVMEGIAAAVGFRNVGAFRTGLGDTTAVTNVLSAAQQPLVGEEWGVQCEVYASQLVDEVDLSNARVRLWWYESSDPWGFDNWKDRPGAKNTWLAPASDSNLVFRSGYFGAPDAVMRAQLGPATVQYMLEVIYRADGMPQTNWLSSADWSTPSWYRPLDYNAEFGAFSAYTILDTVAPGWAWINEVNIFGKYDDNYNNSDNPLQFVEIAAPAAADLSGWTLRFLEAQMGGNPVELRGVITNDVATFGQNGLPSTKTGLKGMDVESKMVFHVVGSPNDKGSLDPDQGQLDGMWRTTYSKEMISGEAIQAFYPIAMQLIRPSGIIESEIVAIGTNEWSYVSSYSAENAAELLSAQEKRGNFVNVGMDSDGIPPYSAWSRSLGVVAGNGESAVQWNNANLMTPGTTNIGQTITGQAPEPRGTALVIYSLLQGDFITQTFGESVDTNASVTLVYRKGAEEGTNITYRTAPWHEIGAVTVNGVAASPAATGNPREWTLSVGKATSNDITVVASAQVDTSLAEKYGVAPDSRYRDAIVKWLMRGMHADGVTGWHDPDATELGLADFADKLGVVEGPMTLVEMYWFDIDPTWPDHAIMLKAGWVDSPTPPAYSCRIFMQITNTVAGGEGWAPYVIQGADFNNNSWEYAKSTTYWEWTNATFKITGLLPVNGITLANNEPRNWIPLRWFVFDLNSFDSDFTSEIVLADPFSEESPGYQAGWYDWKQKHGEEGTPGLFFKWDVSDRNWPRSPEILKPVNPWPLIY